MPYPSPTSGVGVPVKILVAGNETGGTLVPGYNDVTLSLSATGFPSSFQLNPELVDVAGTPVALATALVLSAVASASSGTSVYTGTITGGGTNAFLGKTFEVAGFVTAANNGSFICTASTTTTLTLENGAGVAESHAATATSEEAATNLTYFKDGSASYVGGTSPVAANATGQAVVLVSASGLVSTNGVTGGSVVEVSFPAFNNGSGTTGAISPNPMTNLPLNKIYAEVNVTVVE